MKALLELVRAPAALSVPGDMMAGAAAAGRNSTPGLALTSVLIYWAGMALNDWADREADAVERPERPIPSGRVRPGAALGIAAGLTGAGLVVAAASGGRRALGVAGLLAGAVWAYDLGLKRTPLGPATMASCRALDVLLGAGPQVRAAAPMALAIGAHTYGISILGRAEVTGATVQTVRGALAASTAAAGLAAVSCLRDSSSSKDATARASAALLLAGHLTATIPAQAGLRARPDPEQVRKAVRASILGLIPLQAAAVAGSGRLPAAGMLLGALPAGRWLSARMATS
ncbi:SCO3242 family prenyltransferase [Nonomuraea jabiensis]|uniref:4-hydroxybenzoate polyprenyltransferase n=1 Tax=Nonomuraea jabiensis TaxID=882448 RepID=A0A7W9GDG5_9ACTN|nr:UbiA family prenyltransferase [Nonomuraea jabiensis]MBB5781658.1 4-hydroxybenzoate polyprenyltransferase [Nonomuraea jabiensis]